MNKPARPRKIGHRPCPVCGEKMELVQKGKAEVEVCEAHGIWLDKGELEVIAAAATRFESVRGRAAVRRATAQAKEDGKLKGWLLGPLAFLLD